MTQNKTSGGMTPCVIICWLLAFVFGVFIASALIGWGGANGLLAAIIGLIAMLIVGWLLKGIFCSGEVSSPDVTTDADVAVSAVSAPVEKTVEAPKAKAVAKKPAAKNAATAKKARKT